MQSIDQGTADAGANQLQPGEAEMPEHEEIVQQGVQGDRANGDHHDRPGP